MTTERAETAGTPDDGIAATPPARQDETGASPRAVSSDSLLAGATQLAILHNQSIYFLRQTRFGKLILTK